MALPHAPLKRPYLFLDTESGGLDSGQHSLLSLGFVVGDEGVVRHSLEVLLKHETYIVTGSALKVNRINLSHHHACAMDAPTAMTVMDIFLNQFFPCKHTPIHLVGHNIGFDQAFLKRFWESQGRQFEDRFSHRSIDTHAIAWSMRDAGLLSLENLSSTSLFEHFGVAIPEDKRHTALGDALGTFELYWKMIKRMKDKQS